MQNLINLPSRQQLIRHVIKSMARYWFQEYDALYHLPIATVNSPRFHIPLKLIYVKLPNWAFQCGVNGNLLVPIECRTNKSNSYWTTIDWWLACFLMMECWHERLWEILYGPIHSYSFKLKDWDKRIWDRAWVNRICLFFRNWVSDLKSKENQFKKWNLITPEYILTHDIDAVQKTVAIRIKQSSFELFNGIKALRQRKYKLFTRKVKKAITFLLSYTNWNVLDHIMKQQRLLGIRSVFFFAADSRMKTLQRWLFDPSYNVREKVLSILISKMSQKAWEVGLHPSFDSWNDNQKIKCQRLYLQGIVKKNVVWCRQHWLRFSFFETWEAQEQAGFSSDATLMFNDRPGFRAATAALWSPWSSKKKSPMTIQSQPSILMDSHFYNYLNLNLTSRIYELDHWVKELNIVGGRAAFLWHPQTLMHDYAWEGEYQMLFEKLISSKGKIMIDN